MIEFVRIRNFKSLGELSMRLQAFNCLIGMNGAGKSSVLQAFDFISQLMRGDIGGWLDQLGWSMADLNCKLRKESNITLAVEFRLSHGRLLRWIGVFNHTTIRCTSETIDRRDVRASQERWRTLRLVDRATYRSGAVADDAKFLRIHG